MTPLEAAELLISAAFAIDNNDARHIAISLAFAIRDEGPSGLRVCCKALRRFQFRRNWRDYDARRVILLGRKLARMVEQA